MISFFKKKEEALPIFLPEPPKPPKELMNEMKFDKDGKPKLNFFQKKLMKSAIKQLEEIRKKTDTLRSEEKQKDVVVECIMDMTEMFEILDPSTEKPVTREGLMKHDLASVIALLEEILTEMEMVV